jgi:uncharacterized protein with PQ loop repeat
MEILSSIGWLGSAMLSICGLPAAYQSWRDGHSDGLSWPFLALWTGGEVLTLIYVAPSFNWPLLANYSANLLFLGIMIYFKLNTRRG